MKKKKLICEVTTETVTFKIITQERYYCFWRTTLDEENAPVVFDINRAAYQEAHEFFEAMDKNNYFRSYPSNIPLFVEKIANLLNSGDYFIEMPSRTLPGSQMMGQAQSQISERANHLVNEVTPNTEYSQNAVSAHFLNLMRQLKIAKDSQADTNVLQKQIAILIQPRDPSCVEQCSSCLNEIGRSLPSDFAILRG